MNTINTIISLKNITKTYSYGKPNAFTALHDVSLDIKSGEMCAVCGTSGAGKTTLLNIIGLADTPTSGEYVLNGEIIKNFSDKKLASLRNRYFGYILQDYGLISDETVYENVIIPLIFSNTKRKDYKSKAEKVLNDVGIAELSDKKIDTLSGGQKQRAAIARALINEPTVILADEPTGALDEKTGKEIIQCFRDICNLGKTVVIITHDRNIANMCDRIIEISDGVLIG